MWNGVLFSCELWNSRLISCEMWNSWLISCEMWFHYVVWNVKAGLQFMWNVKPVIIFMWNVKPVIIFMWNVNYSTISCETNHKYDDLWDVPLWSFVFVCIILFSCEMWKWSLFLCEMWMIHPISYNSMMNVLALSSLHSLVIKHGILNWYGI